MFKTLAGSLALPMATKSIGNVSLTNMITQLAHQKEDFIDRYQTPIMK
jgi:hypothetical protein